jgi:hypothetical protein
MTDPCLHLWRAVLLAGLHDAGSGVETGWIGSRDFRTVCALAGLEPDAVLRNFAPQRFNRLRKAA